MKNEKPKPAQRIVGGSSVRSSTHVKLRMAGKTASQGRAGRSSARSSKHGKLKVARSRIGTNIYSKEVVEDS
jgi:hypothetical protein